MILYKGCYDGDKRIKVKSSICRYCCQTIFKAETDFPIDVPKYFTIIDGHPIRIRYVNNKISCSSEDCITGISSKKHVSCESCQHTVKVVKCDVRFTWKIWIQHMFIY